MMIAVCDDDKSSRDGLLNLLGGVRKERDTVAAFSSGVELLESATGGYPYDVTFLDIRMPGLDGLEAARDIRAMAPNTVLVMLTHHACYALDAYRVRPYDYLLKPATAAKLDHILADVRGAAETSDCLSFAYGHSTVTLPSRSIRYIESRKWLTVVYCGNREYPINRRLKDIGEVLPGFISVHRSFLVNPAYIRELDKRGRTLTLASSEIIPVSRGKISEIASLFLRKRTDAS